ncbi:hypothetical protein [Photobacterium leiognathi]|uniref:hypothetical protein n=1 Tax=Photobacterium leiognathi TaxID=553611 RepID=UPI002982A522|nr:hypothetical protein [Photobacterium leiognathi]
MIKSFVSFYRQNGKPAFSKDMQVEMTCVCNEENLAMIQEIISSGIDVDEIIFEGEEVEFEELSPSNGTIDIHLVIPTNGIFHIYSTLEDMLKKAKSLSSGELLKEFYIINDDYYSNDVGEVPLEYQNLKNICFIINGLGELAHYHDSKESKGESSRFIFIDESELITSKPIVIQPQIDIKMLKQPTLDISLIESFSTSLNTERPNSVNSGIEKGFFRVSIIEFLGEMKHFSQIEMFSHLIMKWCDFLNMYQRNLDTYVSGFAFHKARKEVATAEFSIADQYSKVIGDIAGKLFGLPVSFVAVLALFNKDVTCVVEFVILLALVTASWLMSKLVLNQREQLYRINHAKGISFDALEGGKASYPIDLQVKLTEAVDALDNSYNSLDKLLGRLYIVVWLPVLIALLFLGHKYFHVVYWCVIAILH